MKELIWFVSFCREKVRYRSRSRDRDYGRRGGVASIGLNDEKRSNDRDNRDRYDRKGRDYRRWRHHDEHQLIFQKIYLLQYNRTFFFGELVLSLKKKELTMMRVTVFEMTKKAHSNIVERSDFLIVLKHRDCVKITSARHWWLLANFALLKFFSYTFSCFSNPFSYAN